MRHKVAVSLVLSLLSAFLLATETPVRAQPTRGAIISVNDVGDTTDATSGDGICSDASGKCTLRAAIAEANATEALDAIIFDVPVPAVITLSLGELRITNPVRILGRGARRLTVERRGNNDTSSFRVFHIGADTHLRGLTIRNGNSFASGGGILAAARINLQDVALVNNRARSGGGIAFQASKESSFLMDRCLISGNAALGEGGGIYVSAGMYPTLKNVTLTNNSAVSGGAIANYGGLRSTSNTVARNSASQSSSSILNGTAGNFMIINTIVGPDVGQTASSVEGQFSSFGTNIVTNTTGSTGWRGDDLVSTNNGVDPLLGSLADNGGQTDTMALLPGSPAINRGNECVVIGACGSLPGAGDWYVASTDQRRHRRAFSNLPDIGAFETGAEPISGTVMWTLFFGAGTQRHAFSRVTVINTETMERRSTFIVLRDTIQMGTGGTQALAFERGVVYVAEIHTKRGSTSSPTFHEF